MYNIAIRADGGPKVGMGHIMRCLAVAGEFKKLGCRVYFISRYRQGIDIIKAMGFEAFEVVIEAKTGNLATTLSIETTGFNYGSIEELTDDIKETRSITEKQGCDLMLVDKYNLTIEYFNRLKEFVGKVAFIDDLNMYQCSADIIINGNINAPLLGYQKHFEGQTLLIGSKYTPLRKEFRDVPRREIRNFTSYEDKTEGVISKGTDSRKQIPEIMITTGGADPYNCTGKLLEMLLGDNRTSEIKYNVIVSSGFVYKQQIQKMADENSNIVLYLDSKCMAEIMCRSDLAISSGGSTLYELCCCGTPTLAFIMADNQKGIVDTLINGGYIQSIGWYNEMEKANLPQVVTQLVNNFELRKNYSKKIQGLIDGRGASRIAQEFIGAMQREKSVTTI